MAIEQLVLTDQPDGIRWSVALSQQLSSVLGTHGLSDRDAGRIAGVSYRTIKRMRESGKPHTERNICRVYFKLGLVDVAIQQALNSLRRTNPLKYERLRRGATTVQLAKASGVSLSLLFDGQMKVQPVSELTWEKLELAWEKYPPLASQTSLHGGNIIRFTAVRNHRKQVSRMQTKGALNRAIQHHHPNGTLDGATHRQLVKVLEAAMEDLLDRKR